ncbi:DUF4230 domain-containing protein [Pseudarthrobacter sp. H2]|uniref:DUF4230 domain-containing protein n=1 Tax=Pseudarthrobacter sp. H2 TaxID=3418415 RepID=UPI003CF23165
MSQLHSAIGTFELVVDTGDDDEGMPDTIAGRRTLFVAAGTVNAHVDLAGLAEKDLTRRGVPQRSGRRTGRCQR